MTIPLFFKCFRCLNTFSLYDVILGGDFNLISNNGLDKFGGASQQSNYKAREIVRSHKRTMNLDEFFCIFYPYMKTFARIQITPFSASRLDFFLVSRTF